MQLTESRDALVQKVKAILALATSPNRHEAELAMAKAQALIVRHRLGAQDLERKAPDTQEAVHEETFEVPYKAVPDFMHSFLGLFRDHFFVRIYWRHPQVESYRIELAPNVFRSVGRRRVGSIRMTFCGRPIDVELARYTFDYLCRAFPAAWQAYRTGSGGDGSRASRKDFFNGMAQGLREKLRAEQKHVETELGLVLVEDAALRAYMAEHHPRLRHARGRGSYGTESAYAAGQNAGKNLQLRKGVRAAERHGVKLIDAPR